jgi:D-glycero-D-manno-heptose 1,7-bisphosphate phosphatase
VFLDRDGVLNRNVLNPSTGEYESPLTPERFVLFPGVIESLRLLKEAGYLLFLVSNQPNYVKGKASIQTLDAIHRKFETFLKGEGIEFKAFYYCFHHPEVTGPCVCRKPSPYFLYEARDRFTVSLTDSWMVGDRSSDIACGRAAGAKTVYIQNMSAPVRDADYNVQDLALAVPIILTSQAKKNDRVISVLLSAGSM